MEAKDIRDGVLGSYRRLSHLVLLFFAIFLTVVYFTYISDRLNARESDRIEKACLEIKEIQNQIESLLTVYPDSPIIMKELVVQKDHYVDYVEHALALHDPEVGSDETDASNLRLYRDTVDTLMRFYREPKEGLNEWPIEKFAQFETAVYTWKKLQSSNEPKYAKARERLTTLACLWIKRQHVSSDSTPVNDLKAADDLFSIPGVLDQALSRFNDMNHAHPIIARFRSDTALLYSRKRVESIADLKEFVNELHVHQQDLQTQIQSQTYSVPYLGISMRQSAIFVVGVLCEVLVLIYALRQAIQLLGLTQYAIGKPNPIGEQLRETLREAVYLGIIFPLLHQEERKPKKARIKLFGASLSPTQTAVVTLAFALTTIAELAFVCSFIFVPIGFFLLKGWFNANFAGETTPTVDVTISVCLYIMLFFVITLIATVAVVQNSIRNMK